MTECERLIEKGIVTTDFFKEEIMDDFLVSTERKKVWAIELDLYLEFAKVCKKNNLKYFTDGGTTLGAVRHKGFIPWDDDIDVCMPREDYEKFIRLSSEFREPYFLQNSHTDSNHAFSFTRLRNSNTCVVMRKFQYCHFNQGIYIDIFPLDNEFYDTYFDRRKKMEKLVMRGSAFMRKNYPEKEPRDIELIDKYLPEFSSSEENYDEINKFAMENINANTEYVSLIVSTKYAPEKKIWPKYIFDDYVESDFCGHKVRIPKGYDEQLKIYFGNYWEFPPVESRGGWHDDLTFYPDEKYEEFFNTNYWEKEKI